MFPRSKPFNLSLFLLCFSADSDNHKCNLPHLPQAKQNLKKTNNEIKNKRRDDLMAERNINAVDLELTKGSTG